MKNEELSQKEKELKELKKQVKTQTTKQFFEKTLDTIGSAKKLKDKEKAINELRSQIDELMEENKKLEGERKHLIELGLSSKELRAERDYLKHQLSIKDTNLSKEKEKTLKIAENIANKVLEKQGINKKVLLGRDNEGYITMKTQETPQPRIDRGKSQGMKP